jgi:putative SOS response-associated peptidase YedK
MCNEYAREIEMGRISRLTEEMKDIPPFEYENRNMPNDIAPKASIKIRDKGIVARVANGKLSCRSMTSAWAGPHGKSVFNFVSEKRDFSKSDRCLIPVTGFYENTAPARPKV